MIIDLGGVVLDNHPVRARHFVETWKELLASLKPAGNIPEEIMKKLEKTDEEIVKSSIWGTTPANAARKILERLNLESEPSLQQFPASMKEAYRVTRAGKSESIIIEEKPFAGIVGVLENFNSAGYKMIAISRKNPADLEGTLKANEISHLFNGMITTKHEEKTPEALMEGVQQHGVTNFRSILLIGDTESDMAAALGAGMRALMARWGQPERLLNYPGLAADKIEDLPAMVTRAFHMVSLPVLTPGTVR